MKLIRAREGIARLGVKAHTTGMMAAAATAALLGLVAPGMASAAYPGPSFNAVVNLSGTLMTARAPSISYTANANKTFGTIDEVDIAFTFGSGSDAVGANECIQVTGGFPGVYGFCNPGPQSQTSRLLSFPCITFGDVCNAYMDGRDGGQITLSSTNKAKTVSARIASLQITVYGCPAGMVCIAGGGV